MDIMNHPAFVNHVVINARPAKEQLIIVLNVKNQENMHHIVLAHQVTIVMNMKNV